IWHDFMEYALKGTPVHNFTKPSNIVTVRVSRITGLLPNPGEPSYEEVFVKGTQPKTRSTYVVATPSRDQLIATATAVSALATAEAKGTPLPPGVSLTPPAIPTLQPTSTPEAKSGTPGAGTPTPGPAATVVVRSGSKQAVPNVVGLPEAQAVSLLQSSGLTVGSVTYSTQASVPVGSVINQNPAPGTQVDPGSAVSLLVRNS
ncbi:MAG: PASTA domain-containing protein, partial [Chloroflexota bacterium]|nr:PASTA domain-containing protein [Chloroflexota bacterium]